MGDELRTHDVDYGESYWNTLDAGAGYVDSTMHEDLAHAVKEVFGIDRKAGVDISASINVVDVGCASGFLVRHLRRRGFDAWGLDISKYALEHAPADTADYLRWYDLTGIDGSFFGTEKFRLLTCLETLEHIPEEHVDRALGHLHDLLEPGGHALLTICTDSQPGWDTDPTHVTIKPAAWWRLQLGRAGFARMTRPVEELRRFWLFSLHHGVFVVQRPGDT